MSDLEIKRTNISKDSVELIVKVSEARLKKVKKHTLELMKPEVEAPGFRKGKVPLKVVEKQL